MSPETQTPSPPTEGVRPPTEEARPPTEEARPPHEGARPPHEGARPPHDDEEARILARLKSIEGHVRGIHRMVGEGEYCVDIVHQVLAVQKALKKVSAMVLDRHLHHCASAAIRGPDADERERVLNELLDLFEAAGRA